MFLDNSIPLKQIDFYQDCYKNWDNYKKPAHAIKLKKKDYSSKVLCFFYSIQITNTMRSEREDTIQNAKWSAQKMIEFASKRCSDIETGFDIFIEFQSVIEAF